MLAGDRGRRGRSEQHGGLRLDQVGQARDALAGAHPDAAARDVAVQAADPLVLARVVGRFLVAEQRLQRGRGGEHPQHRAVLRRIVEDGVGHVHRAGAGHVLHHDRRRSRHVLAEMLGEQPRHGVVAAAGAEADLDGDLAALVEVRHRIGTSSRNDGGRGEQRRQGADPIGTRHHGLPPLIRSPRRRAAGSMSAARRRSPWRSSG